MSYLCGLGFSASSHTAAKLVTSLGLEVTERAEGRKESESEEDTEEEGESGEEEEGSDEEENKGDEEESEGRNIYFRVGPNFGQCYI